MANLEATLAALRHQQRLALVPYFPVGFPEPDSALALIAAAAEAGADAIELGVPFSDPLADGPIIQQATTRALQHQITLGHCLATVRAARAAGYQLPLLLMGYYNPILRFGVARFAAEAAAAGVAGCIVPDLPPEERGELLPPLEVHGIPLIPMVAPTSPPARIRLATAGARGFVYCISVTGVTGARHDLPPDLPAFVERVRAVTDLPIGIGFGISQPAHLEALRSFADLAIIGSAIVAQIDRPTTAEAARALSEFLRRLRGAVVAR
ncbi:MAG: tryptophan synthase subunit alpha [Chloroflexi bacterium]|nr:tryptophan synthase subunit alpha [Chloroflexota bacterium]GIW10556.1 MAG: tryptophan synthase alpha chain [Dehalococcoidia bacterium]